MSLRWSITVYAHSVTTSKDLRVSTDFKLFDFQKPILAGQRDRKDSQMQTEKMLQSRSLRVSESSRPVEHANSRNSARQEYNLGLSEVYPFYPL